MSADRLPLRLGKDTGESGLFDCQPRAPCSGRSRALEIC